VRVVERWTDTLLLIKNVSEDVTEDQLKEIFSDAEDIVFAKQHDYRRKDDKKTK
jgi:RNA recognition motif. (a.k.a. RRM, RBD, or RNP domain)